MASPGSPYRIAPGRRWIGLVLVCVAQIIERIIELNELADRGQPVPSALINASATLNESSFDTELDDVFAAPPTSHHHHHHRHHHQQQHLLSAGVRPNSGLAPPAAAAANTSFDIRPSAAPPVQVRETTM